MSVSAGLYPLILLSLGVGVLEFLLPGDRNGKSSAAFRAVAGLCVLLAILVPLARGLSLLRDIAAGGTDDLRGRLEQSGILPPDDGTVGLTTSQAVSLRQGKRRWSKGVRGFA